MDNRKERLKELEKRYSSVMKQYHEIMKEISDIVNTPDSVSEKKKLLSDSFHFYFFGLLTGTGICIIVMIMFKVLWR